MANYEFKEINDVDRYHIIKQRRRNIEHSIYTLELAIEEAKVTTPNHTGMITTQEQEREDKIKFIKEVLDPALAELEPKVPAELR